MRNSKNILFSKKVLIPVFLLLLLGIKGCGFLWMISDCFGLDITCFWGGIIERLYIKPKGLLLPSDNCSILFLNWIELI